LLKGEVLIESFVDIVKIDVVEDQRRNLVEGDEDT